ncbi:hypothetical protein H6G36_19335 [Anabaena minutissima FACHB-250]|nr:hypothetical protein [Anabaena minutissima FACHB-250]
MSSLLSGESHSQPAKRRATANTTQHSQLSTHNSLPILDKDVYGRSRFPIRCICSKPCLP